MRKLDGELREYLESMVERMGRSKGPRRNYLADFRARRPIFRG